MTRRPRSRRCVCPHPSDPVWPGARCAPVHTPAPVIRTSVGSDAYCARPFDLADRVAPQLPGLSSPADRRNCEVCVEEGQVGSRILNFPHIQGTSTLFGLTGHFRCLCNHPFTVSTRLVPISRPGHRRHFSVASQQFLAGNGEGTAPEGGPFAFGPVSGRRFRLNTRSCSARRRR
jgi:hypothetical protein